MDARAHLDSYRESLKKDALEGCVEYSRFVKTARPDLYPTVYDYMKYTLDAAKYHAEADDPASYKLWLPKHQEAMILLFERMVGEVLFDVEPTLEVLLALIHERGWNWFKFQKKSITYKIRLENDELLELKIIPRYRLDTLCATDTRPGVALMDSDEISSVLALSDTALARQIANHKKEHPGMKFMGMALMEREARVEYQPLPRVNGERVRDWAMPLFGGLQ